jgi:hypothetical protein
MTTANQSNALGLIPTGRWNDVSPNLLLEYTAADFVKEIIAGLGRTEDIKFSPSNSRLALACFLRNQVAVFDLCRSSGERIVLTNAFLISSSHLRCPHGVDFLTDKRIVVANREGDLTIFDLPYGGKGNSYNLDPVGRLSSDDLIKTPGAVSVRRSEKLYEMLVCNNRGNCVTRHLVDLNGQAISNRMFLRKWLHFPDGVSVGDGWLAVTNNECRNVLLYDMSKPANEKSYPEGILRYVYRPHGVRFTLGGRLIAVADYESPYVHVYMGDNGSWRGVRGPVLSLRVISDEDFLRGPTRAGGPKGLDIDSASKILVTTSEVQPLAFFDFAMAREKITVLHGDYSREERMAWEMEYELRCQDEVQREVASLTSRLSWKVTGPFRWLLTRINSILSVCL